MKHNSIAKYFDCSSALCFYSVDQLVCSADFLKKRALYAIGYDITAILESFHLGIHHSYIAFYILEIIDLHKVVTAYEHASFWHIESEISAICGTYITNSNTL